MLEFLINFVLGLITLIVVIIVSPVVVVLSIVGLILFKITLWFLLFLFCIALVGKFLRKLCKGVSNGRFI